MRRVFRPKTKSEKDKQTELLLCAETLSAVFTLSSSCVAFLCSRGQAEVGRAEAQKFLHLVFLLGTTSFPVLALHTSLSEPLRPENKQTNIREVFYFLFFWILE